jgi:hypothetical protein
MSTFTGSFQIEGDASSLPASVSIEHDTLRLVSRSHLIGEWPIADVDVEETDSGVTIVVEGERVRLDLTDQQGFVLAAGVLRKPPEKKTGRWGRKRREEAPAEAPTEPPPPPKQRRSIPDVIDGWLEELRPDFDEVRNTAQAAPRGRLLWISLGVFAVAAVIIPTVVVIALTAVGTIATLLAVFGYLDNSIRVRFPNRFPPIVVLAGGLALLVIAVAIASIPDHPLSLL